MNFSIHKYLKKYYLIIYYIRMSNQLLIMNKSSLEKLSKTQLIEILLKQEKKKPEIIVVDDTKPVPAPRTYKPRPPIPTPRKGVKQMVQDYEDNKPVPAPRTIKPVKAPVPTPRTKKLMDKPVPIPAPRTKIEQTDKALKGYTKSYEISIKNNKDPSIQMQNTRLAIKIVINSQLNEMKGLKYVKTLKVTFKKQM